MIPLAFAAALALPPAPPAVESVEPLPGWTAKFRRTDGWVGADGAYSVPLPDHRTLWLFGDTFVGSVRDGKRVKVKMVNNTVGVQHGSGEAAKLSFAIGGTADKPAAIFTPPDGKGWFWPVAGVPVGDRLAVFLPHVEKTNAPGAFGFQIVGQQLVVVENPSADPTAWKMAYSKLPFTEFTKNHTLSFGSAVLRVGEFAYIYGFEEKPGKLFPTRKMVLARAPADKLTDFSAWRFFTADGWKAEAKSLAPLVDQMASEYSVTYLPGLKRYAVVYTENGLSDRILGCFAETPEGPWSQPVLLYRCPEMKRSKEVFSYAAKAHPQLGGDRELVISYCVNSFGLGPVINDASLYWPNFLRVKLKPADAGERPRSRPAE